MKSLSATVAILGLMLAIPSASQAASGTQTARVSTISILDNSSPAQYITLEGVTSAGTCYKSPAAGALVQFRLPDTAKGDQMRPIIVSAMMAGRIIRVSWDDTSRDTSNRCYIKVLSIYQAD